MGKEAGEILGVPMLQCLKRITEELADKLRDLSGFVKERTGKNLNLELVSIVQNAENDFRIKVRGITHSGRMTEEEFQVLWLNHVCPAYFHLYQRDRVPFDIGYAFVYCGVIEANSEILAKEIAIYTHHLQIPGILSRKK